MNAFSNVMPATRSGRGRIERRRPERDLGIDRRHREPPSPGRRAASLAAIVARARERAKLSQRELATLADLSNSTVARLERGEDARWDTVRGIAAHLPGITAASVLQPRSRHPPQASAAAVAACRRLFGFGADAISQRLIVESGGATLETRIEGLALEPDAAASAEDVHVVTALMRIACVGSPRFRRPLDGARLLAASGELDLDEGAARHRFTLRPENGWRLTYSCVAPSVDSAGAFSTRHVVGIPVRELRLELAGVHGMPALQAWTPTSLRERADSDLADRLHPGGLGSSLERRDGLLRAVIAQPLVGVAYELVGSGETPPARPAAGRTRGHALDVVASRAVSLRKDAGLTLRAMADRVGVSFATVREIEAGRPPRVSTIAAYLRAFPLLAPQELLPMDDLGGSLSDDELWDYQRRVFGFCADEYEKVLRVKSDGRSQTTATVRGIRSESSSGSASSLRLAFGRAVMTDRPATPMQRMLASSEDLRVRTVRHREGGLTHLLTF